MIDLSGRLASGDTLYGTFLGLGSALAAEACALAGFDWLLTDLEHGGGDESELLHQQLAADAHGVPMLVRVESTHRIRAGHALDLGAAGIMFPGINSAEQATQAIRHLRYPSDGDRGVACGCPKLGLASADLLLCRRRKPGRSVGGAAAHLLDVLQVSGLAGAFGPGRTRRRGSRSWGRQAMVP